MNKRKSAHYSNKEQAGVQTKQGWATLDRLLKILVPTQVTIFTYRKIISSYQVPK
jgi:hypothetical protein